MRFHVVFKLLMRLSFCHFRLGGILKAPTLLWIYNSMTQPPINPLANMKVDYWYKALMVIGGLLFVLNGTSFLNRYPMAPVAFLSAGIFFIGLWEWVNHPLRTRIVAPNIIARGYTRSNSPLGIAFDILGVALIAVGIFKFF
ncbi:hypothetical protein MUU49_07375 [Scandinavium goeteborgense]|uniref:hypothetical protein n=1 Tax=Scandinavium goeteborgense TaxID=1851514 RepID=UPI0021662D23|nr:hypothetical protein [Scandinavium goeteborgense]MCS2152401.1 hypothetical protein [Scandinavium goeteborgense]